MKKEKKITVKFFLNTALQPQVDGKIKRFPAYMLVTYNRKNTMIKSQYATHYYKDLNELESSHYPGLIAFEERLMQKSVAYELDKQGNKFDLKGLAKSYQYYSRGIQELMSQYMKDILWSIILRLEPFEYMRALNFSDPDVEFETLLTIVKKIYPGFNDFLTDSLKDQIEIHETYTKVYRGSLFDYSFQTVIDWLNGNALEDLSQRVFNIGKNDIGLIRKAKVFISKIIEQGQYGA